MDFNIYNKKKELIYGHSIESEYKTVREMRKGEFIIRGCSNYLEGPVITRMLKEIEMPQKMDLLSLLTHFRENYFAGQKLKNLENIPQKDIFFDVNERISAILNQNGNNIHSYCYGSVICKPRFKNEKELSVFYTFAKTEIEMHKNLRKFKAHNSDLEISTYTFVPKALPIKIFKKTETTYVVGSLLSDKSNIRIIFPKIGEHLKVSAQIGVVQILQSTIEWNIENEKFKQTQIDIEYDKNSPTFNSTRFPNIPQTITIHFDSKCFSLSEMLIKTVQDSMNHEIWVNYNCKSINYEIREE